MFTPQFPYKGNQIIISSDRVMVHSKNDAVFIFGKQAVSLSSPKTINLDATQKVLIYSPKIELGTQAETLGDPVVLGNKLNQELINLLKALSTTGMMLSNASESDLGGTMTLIAAAGKNINKECNRLINALDQKTILSKNTFTR